MGISMYYDNFFRLQLLDRSNEVVTVQSGNSKAVILAHPFKIRFYEGKNEVAVLNSRGLFTLEHLRTKPNEYVLYFI